LICRKAGISELVGGGKAQWRLVVTDKMPSRRPRYYYKGPLARPLRPGEPIELKYGLLLKELKAADKAEGFEKLAARHVPGFVRTMKAEGRRTIDPGTEAQVFELVDDTLREARAAGRKISMRQAVAEIWSGVDRNHPVRQLTVQTWYTHYKNRTEREQTYERSHEDRMSPLRDRLGRINLGLPTPSKDAKIAGDVLDQILGQPADMPLRRQRARRGRR